MDFSAFSRMFFLGKKKKKATPHSCLNPIWNPPAPGAAKVGGKQEKTGKKKSRGEKKYKKSLFPTARARASSSCKHSQTSCWKTRQAAWGFYGIGAFLGFFFFFPFSAGGSFQGSRGRAAFPGIIGSMCGWRDGCGAAALERDVGKIPGAENSREIPP